jgi:hypothetical protein
MADRKQQNPDMKGPGPDTALKDAPPVT